MKNVIALLLVSLAQMATALELNGELTQGAMVWGRVEPSTRLFLEDEQIRVADNGVFAIGFDRDAPETMTLKVCHADDSCQARVLDIAQRQYRIQEIEGVPQRTVTPPPEALARIRREAAKVSAARSEFLYRQDFTRPFIWPLRGTITGVFGSQRVYNGDPGRPHYGVDIAGPVGATVVAPVEGVVTLAHDDMFYSGGTLIIDHGHGISSTFIHLSKVLVKPGQQVKQGQPIAEVGATGRATGPHLDWRMNWFGKRLDPALLVGEMPPEKSSVAGANKRQRDDTTQE